MALLQTNRYARRHSFGELGQALASLLDALEPIPAHEWTTVALGRVMDGQADALGWKRAEVLMPIRIIVSGREATPPLFETLACVTRAATLRRIRAVLQEMPNSE